MNNTKQNIAPFVCGFGAAVLSIVPGLKSFTCCLIVPFAAFFSLFLEKKINKDEQLIDYRKAVTFGLLTGLFSALFSTLFDTLLTLLTHTNDFVVTLPDTLRLISDYQLGLFMDETINVLKSMAEQIKQTGFSAFYTFTILVSNLLINTVFGLIGGLIGMNYLNKKMSQQ